MNPKRIMEMVCEMAMLPFFPGEDEGRLGIVRMLGKMATNEEQIRWLIDRMTSGLYSKWLGPAELRAIFCMKYKPADGIEAISEVYPEGLSREQLNPGKKLALPAPEPPLRLTGSTETTSDSEMMALVAECAKPTRLSARVPPEMTELLPGESEIQGLMRHCRKYAPAETQPWAVSQAEIDRVLEFQNANRRETECPL